ncbi:MAG: methionine adenosyltransferase [Candidatus Woesebacteria bacterium]|jgi:S-adenosylmethionine synthetase
MFNKLFTSESVAAGHPDKACDYISDCILDALLAKDPFARTGIETVVGDNHVFLLGEINTTAKVDFAPITKQAISDLGYTNPDWGFSDQSIIKSLIHQQSPDIALGTNNDKGAGDQGMMFGYACRESDELMPLPIVLAHALTKKLDEVRQSSTLAFVRPDGKAQVTVEYKNDKPIGIKTVVMAVAHSEDAQPQAVKNAIFEHVVAPVLENYGYSITPKDVIINGTGVWHIPGPQTDAGLTGRKIVVDGYGGYARVGGGAFSGKDPSKVDRSGAYAARFIAKNIVAHGLASRCEVGLAYVIGHSAPIMEEVETFGTANTSNKAISSFVKQLINTSVSGIVEKLDLRRPIYKDTAAYGHFGREQFPWEQIQKSV